MFSLACNVSSKRSFFLPLKTSGEKLGAAPFDKLGIMFVEFDSAAAMFDVTPNFVEVMEIGSFEKMYG